MMNKQITTGSDNPEAGFVKINTTDNKEQFHTPFSIAWDRYKESADYTNKVIAMEKSGMKQPYICNILKTTFSEGWNSK